MATPSQVVMLREISAAADRERTGAFDVGWDGAHASLFFTFGHPSHVVFESADGRTLAGDDALTTLLAELPAEFTVAAWRRAMVTEDTVHLSAADLVARFEAAAPVATNGHHPEPRHPDESGSVGVATEDGDPVSITADGEGDLGAGDAAAVVAVEGEAAVLGDDPPQPWSTTIDGDIIDDPRIIEGLPALWRGLRPADGFPGGWLQADALIAEVRGSGRTCALLVSAGEIGAALFQEGELVAVYTTERRLPTTAGALRSLLEQPDAHVTVATEGLPSAATASTAEPEPVAPETTAAGGPGADLDAEPVDAGDVEFVPMRLEVDVDGLRRELTEMAVVWLGADDTAPVARAIASARPGVDDFVTTIARIAAMQIPGHENAMVRAMAREMHYRAAEVLCGA